MSTWARVYSPGTHPEPSERCGWQLFGAVKGLERSVIEEEKNALLTKVKLKGQVAALHLYWPHLVSPCGLRVVALLHGSSALVSRPMPMLRVIPRTTPQHTTCNRRSTESIRCGGWSRNRLSGASCHAESQW
jgi:hypothetical protein